MTEKGSFIPFSILKWVTWCNISALSQWATICWRLFPFKLSTSPYRGGGITTDSMQPGRNIRPADIPTPNHAHSWRKRESISEDLFLFIFIFFFKRHPAVESIQLRGNENELPPLLDMYRVPGNLFHKCKKPKDTGKKRVKHNGKSFSFCQLQEASSSSSCNLPFESCNRFV